MQAFYCDHFVLPLPPGHRFPMAKYRMLRDWIAMNLPGVRLEEPPAATDGQLALAHTPAYIQAVSQGVLAPDIQKAIGFPWSHAMVIRARHSVGATIAACRAACVDSVAANLAGGTHHAYADAGSGFCVFNDAAVAARLMQAERRVQRVLILDLDVHQGNGTAHLLRSDPTIFTLSLHGENNFPFQKAESDWDVGLPDGTDDAHYLSVLENVLQALPRRFVPDLVIYLAGADPHEHDRLGKLKLTFDGLAARDAMVLKTVRNWGVPIAITMAGGYGREISDTVAIHSNTIKLAAAYSLSG